MNWKTLNNYSRRAAVHDRVSRRLKGGDNPFTVLDSLSSADLSRLMTLHQLRAVNQFGGPSDRKPDKITALLDNVYAKADV